MIYSGSPVETPFPRSCLLLGCEQMTFSSVWSGDFVLIQLTSLLFFFQNTFWEVETDTCVTTWCQCGVSKWPRGAGANYNQGKVLFYCAAMPATTTRGPHPNIWDSSFLILSHTFSDLMFDVFLIHPFHAQVKKFFDALWADQHQLHDETSSTSVSREKEI